jgi:hypothetical protein
MNDPLAFCDRKSRNLMRESKKTEKMHLPRGSTELWLESRTPTKGGVKHRNPPENSYETWVEKRVERSRGPSGTVRKKRRRASA